MAEGIRGEVRRRAESIRLLNNFMEKRNGKQHADYDGAHDGKNEFDAPKKEGILPVPLGLAQGSDAAKGKPPVEGYDGLSGKHLRQT
jgi:hypothetical protein